MPELEQTWWHHPDKGRATVVRASQELAQEVDRAWVPRRRAWDAHAWTWVGLYGEGGQFDVLMTDTNDPEFVAAWQLDRIELHSKSGSRLAGALRRVETSPILRGDQKTWLLTLGIICWHAVQFGAELLVLGALPQVEKVYRGSGATRGRIHGWNCSPTLVPYRYDQEALRRYAEGAERVRYRRV